eukprot:m.1620390 g.1620390  ORF g.1620390 m.1620390 type:complete len:789 (+) comp25383_c0_seq37:330-2696(+)
MESVHPHSLPQGHPFACPISLDIMTDPVTTADGQSYERSAIEHWLRNRDTSPATGAPLPNKTVTPNVALRNSIQEWQDLQEQPQNRPQPIDLFVVRSTGEIFDAQYLFTNGYKLSDCDRLSDRATLLREELRIVEEVTKNCITQSLRNIDKMNDARSSLEKNRSAVRMQVDCAMDAIRQQLVDAVDERRRVLLAKVDEEASTRNAVLITQLEELQSDHATRVQKHKDIQKALTQGDEELVRSAANSELVDGLTVSRIHPVECSEIVFSIGCTQPVDDAWFAVLGDIERNAVDPPMLRGYADERPVYVAGDKIVPNIPTFSCNGAGVFWMEPGVPAGLVLDSSTGVLSGTPQWTSDAGGADEIELQRTVVLANSAGMATAELNMTLQSAVSDATSAFLQKHNLSITESKWDLADRCLEDRQVSVLASALKYNHGLQTLHLGENQIGIEGAKALARALGRNLRLSVLSLDNNTIQDAGVAALVKAFGIGNSLTTLTLDNNQIQSDGLKAVAAALTTNLRVTTLMLRANVVRHSGAAALADSLGRNLVLSTLVLCSCQVEDSGVSKLAKALETNTSLTTLNLDHNNVGDAGATALGHALVKNSSLAVLLLANNQLQAQGATALAQALKTNATLTKLGIQGNRIEHAGAEALAEALAVNHKLATLYIHDGRVADAGAIALAKALESNDALTTLTLQKNTIGNAGASALAEALKQNTTLTTLFLGHNRIEGEGAETFVTVLLKRNSSLSALDLRSNHIGESAKHLQQVVSIRKGLSVGLAACHGVPVPGSPML